MVATLTRKTLLLLILVSLTISNNCNNDGLSKKGTRHVHIEDKPYSLEFVKEKTLTKINAVCKPFPIIGKVKSNDSLTVLFTNKEKHLEIWKFDMDFSSKKKYFVKYGQGPNECLSPIFAGGDDTKICIFDSIIDRYYLYEGDFQSRRTIKSKNLGTLIFYGCWNFSTENNTIVSAFWNPLSKFKGSYSLYTRKLTGDRVNDKKIYNSRIDLFLTDTMYLDGQPYHFLLSGNHIFFLKTDEYRLIKMDLEGNVLKQIQVTNVDKKTFSKPQLARWLKKYRELDPKGFTFPEELWPAAWVIELKDGIAVARRRDYNPIKTDWIICDYFDKELNYLGKINYPWFPGWNHPSQGQKKAEFFSYLHEDGKLYCLEYKETENDENYYLTRWRIENEK